MQIKKYTRESINEKIKEVDKKLISFYKKTPLDLALGEILDFYGRSFFDIKAGWIWTQRYISAQEMIIECLKNNKNRTRSVFRPVGLLRSTLLDFEELISYKNTFEYHNVSEIEEVDDIFIHHIPIEMSEVDAKRVISDWLVNHTQKMFISPTDQSLQELIKKSEYNHIGIKNLLGYNYDDLIKVEENLSEYLVRHAIVDFQRSCGRELTQEEKIENSAKIEAYPLVFLKNKFRKRLRELNINEKYYEGLLLPISSFPNCDNVLNEYPYKGAFIELDSYRFITSFWWYKLHGGGGIKFYLDKSIKLTILEKTFEDDTRKYLEDIGFLSFKISKPVEIDGIGTSGPYLVLVENLHSHLPIDTRNAYLKSIDSTLKGRIGKRFLNKYIQIDKRYNWMIKEGLEFLKGNPHYKKACIKSDIILPIILTPNKEMLPDKIGRFIIINTRIFGYLINNIPSCISIINKKIDGLEVIFLPMDLYGLLSKSAFLPRVGKKTIILPDMFQNEDLSKIFKLQKFIYLWECNVANLGDSFSIKSLLDDLDYSNSKDVILLAIISTALRDIMILNNLLRDKANQESARYLLYILDNINNELFSELDPESTEVSNKEVLAAMVLNFSNCKMSTFFDKMIIDFLGNSVDYPIEFSFPFIDSNFHKKYEQLTKITNKRDILTYSKLMFDDVFKYIKSRKAEYESSFFRYIAAKFGLDFL